MLLVCFFLLTKYQVLGYTLGRAWEVREVQVWKYFHSWRRSKYYTSATISGLNQWQCCGRKAGTHWEMEIHSQPLMTSWDPVSSPMRSGRVWSLWELHVLIIEPPSCPLVWAGFLPPCEECKNIRRSSTLFGSPGEGESDYFSLVLREVGGQELNA